MNTGVFTHLYPTTHNPLRGIFVKEQLAHLAQFADIKLLAPLSLQRWVREYGSPQDTTDYPVKSIPVLTIPRRINERANALSFSTSAKLFAPRYFEDRDVIHAHFAFPDVVAAYRTYFGRGKPIVATVHGSDIYKFAQKPQLRDCVKEALESIACTICVSTGLQREIRESLSITGRTEVIPNGVDTDIFLPGPRDEASAQLGLVPSRFRFIFAGVYKPAKGIDVLLDAMRIVHEKYPDSELILIGKSNNSPYYRQYAEQAGSLGITQAVRFVPLMPKSVLAAWFRASDAFVLSSRTEGFGIVLCEAMSCGLPVIATRSGGPEDIVDDTNGLLVDPGDCDLLANAMMRMYENIRLYRSRKEEIREFVKSRYGFESVAARIVEVYRSVL